jgi:hypothetical protein
VLVMAYSRIFGILDRELTQHLAFAFSIAENLTAPGSTTLRANDSFRFTVWATNNSGIPLKAVEGSIRPTGLADFSPTDFTIQHLSPKKRKHIATIDARVTRLMHKDVVRFSRIGIVTVAVSADLSRYRLEKSQPLTYIKSAHDAATAPKAPTLFGVPLLRKCKS